MTHTGQDRLSPEDGTGADSERLREALARALTPEFELLRALGSGRAAHVFLARELALKRLVAVKVLRPDVGEDETARGRFEREAHSAAGISHPRVPAVHRIGRLESGLPYIVQGYVEGRKLRDRLEAMGAAQPEEARRILADVAAALSASHSKGVIHRDVRPGNVMLERDTGHAFLTDFGLAAARDTGTQSDARLTQTGEILGDPHYASPEQLRGEKVTAQADVYSLGVLGYEILTLSNPFGSGSRHELFTAHLRGDPSDLPWEVKARDPELGEILLRCLQKEPARRPRAEEVFRALTDGSSGGGASSGPAAGTPMAILAPFPKLAAFVGELGRRRVVRVAVAYLVGALLLLQGAGDVLGGLEAPTWIYRMLVFVAVGGLPVVLVLILGVRCDEQRNRAHRTDRRRLWKSVEDRGPRGKYRVGDRHLPGAAVIHHLRMGAPHNDQFVKYPTTKDVPAGRFFPPSGILAPALTTPGPTS